MIDIIHQLLIFGFVYDRNDLISFLHIVGTVCFINGGSAVQIVNNEISQFFFFFCNDSNAAFDVVIKNKMVKHNSVKICTKNTQYDGLFVINKCSGQCDTHTGE